MTIEKAIARLIEFYNKAKKENRKYPVFWAVHKLDEWCHHILSYGKDGDRNDIETGKETEKR